MTRLIIRIPNDLYQNVKAFAEKKKLSVNEFILFAVAKEVRQSVFNEVIDAWLADDSTPYEHYGPDEYDKK